eukprot:gnl/TRDRNA2_/TRDRNA2_67966_c0_seq1.p1 gnl/TRDRNA2_/TRDRNA2_67966_c0~~gnl/TRDRNA2_/TRDRNA2_67966_c0_seq1.p1  ORF type:complete len:106 (+),score=8.82 gnl/TRDRNA2_/TRDRNA2_67966_c0_seq1:132-449(+)
MYELYLQRLPRAEISCYQALVSTTPSFNLLLGHELAVGSDLWSHLLSGEILKEFNARFEASCQAAIYGNIEELTVTIEIETRTHAEGTRNIKGSCRAIILFWRPF